ncbi:hypothetical protein TrLO_g5506 [Triparma laevis f. longispina]|uniref:MYND-type domain-containing protein n=1 Tax=Triparma laevis f. longispina TaxID=1714387 RepID=A0A9W7FGP0_9STRA|nr:hypothetical protein TrLO_g5506 [Triparma laevis f. longispina]
MESPNKFALHSAISSNDLPLITSIIQSDPTSVNLIDDKVTIVQNALDNVNHRQFITTGAAEGQKRCLKSKKILERYLAQTPYGCNACGAGPQVLSLCNGCKIRGYCNRECQLKDWKTHKKVCGKEEIVWNVLTAEETVVGSGKKKGKGKKGKKK